MKRHFHLPAVDEGSHNLSGGQAQICTQQGLGRNLFWGARISTQRMGTGGMLGWNHTAVADTISTPRCGSRYQFATVTAVQDVAVCGKTCGKVGQRFPSSVGVRSDPECVLEQDHRARHPVASESSW